MGTGTSGRRKGFGEFPVRVVSEEIVVVQEGDRSEGEVNVSGQPTWWSRNSSEDFVIVGSSKTKISVDMVGSRGSNHTATFFCLDRVITFCSGGSLILFI